MSAELSAPAHVTAVSPLGRAFIVSWEGGHRLEAYQCSAGYWTIGAGMTRYPDTQHFSLTGMLPDTPEYIAGTVKRKDSSHDLRVREGDRINATLALLLFRETLDNYEVAVDAITRDDISQRQFDALVSFAWNLGVKALEGSTLLKFVNERHPAPEVLAQFGRWVYADVDPDHPGLEKVPGLIRRRRAEAIVYDHGLYEGPDGQLVTAEERKQ